MRNYKSFTIRLTESQKAMLTHAVNTTRLQLSVWLRSRGDIALKTLPKIHPVDDGERYDYGFNLRPMQVKHWENAASERGLEWQEWVRRVVIPMAMDAEDIERKVPLVYDDENPFVPDPAPAIDLHETRILKIRARRKQHENWNLAAALARESLPEWIRESLDERAKYQLEDQYEK